jgi:hypothetical protein
VIVVEVGQFSFVRVGQEIDVLILRSPARLTSIFSANSFFCGLCSKKESLIESQIELHFGLEPARPQGFRTPVKWPCEPSMSGERRARQVLSVARSANQPDMQIGEIQVDKDWHFDEPNFI